MRFLAFVLTLAAMACSSGGGDDDSNKSTRAQCDQTEADIRHAAEQRGIAPDGICSSTNPQIQRDFASACKALEDCNAHCCK